MRSSTPNAVERRPRGAAPTPRSGPTDAARVHRRRTVTTTRPALVQAARRTRMVATGRRRYPRRPMPHDDGHPDPGEVVWAWVPYEEDHSQGKDRPVLVIARHPELEDVVLALPLTSKDHDRDAAQEAQAGRHWMDVGSGAWDNRGRRSEVRLDRVLQLDVTRVRREGSHIDEQTFDAVIAAARTRSVGR